MPVPQNKTSTDVPLMNSPRRSADTRVLLSGAAVLLSLGMGIRQSFGLFLTPVTRDLALTAADFTLAVAVQNIIWGLSHRAGSRAPTHLTQSIPPTARPSNRYATACAPPRAPRRPARPN